MTTRKSREFISQFYAYKGGSKPVKAQVVPTTSQYDGTNDAGFNTDFGSASSQLSPYQYTDPLTGQTNTKNQISTNASLAPELQPSALSAASGLSNNLDFLNRSPSDQISYLTSGQDPLYNLTQEQNNRAVTQALGRAAVNAQTNGGSNSTALGGAVGSVLNDNIIRQNSNLISALQNENQTATSNANTNLGAISGLNNLISPLASAANNNLLTALNSQDQATAQTAAAQNAANANYAAATNAYNQKQQQSLSNTIGGALGTVGSVALAPFTGGASLAALPSSLSNLGGGTTSTPYTPQYNPYNFTNPFTPSIPQSTTIPLASYYSPSAQGFNSYRMAAQ